jgi:hypothetical protein
MVFVTPCAALPLVFTSITYERLAVDFGDKPGEERVDISTSSKTQRGFTISRVDEFGW